MPQSNKPSSAEEEYFLRREAEALRKAAAEARAKIEQAEKDRLRALHYMKCPKCGMDLQEVTIVDLKVDKCFGCEGVWLDDTEMETLTRKEGLLGRIKHTFFK